MYSNLSEYTQYKKDIFQKIAFPFERGKNLLDVGCGDGSDAVIFKNVYGLDVKMCDIYRDSKLDTSVGEFSIGSILDLPYSTEMFDYVFVHDVMHHIDEERQDRNKHILALEELRRVTKKNGTILVLEANRYNPLFYPHMVKIRGHNHFRHEYFKSIILQVFPNVEFRYFEAHMYPPSLLRVFKIYEYIMEHYVPKRFLAYNLAIIKNGGDL